MKREKDTQIFIVAHSLSFLRSTKITKKKRQAKSNEERTSTTKRKKATGSSAGASADFSAAVLAQIDNAAKEARAKLRALRFVEEYG